VDADELELARAAVATLRSALAGHTGLIMAADTVAATAGGLAVFLLAEQVDPHELDQRLRSLDSFLVDRQVALEVANVDWDVLLTEG
jgi:hypothetical protein